MIRSQHQPKIRALLAAIAVFCSAGSLATAQQADTTPPASFERQLQVVYREALRIVTPVIVRIDTIGGAQPVQQKAESQDAPRAPAGFRQADGPTTGVIWSADGYIVTSSFNFLRNPSVITVSLSDGRRYVAQLVARDQPARLALLKIDADSLPVARWRPLERLRPGQRVLAAGFGHGSRAPALTAGVLSATGRMNGLALQTDAKISPANYGGPLFDVEGALLGICVPMGPGQDELAGVQWYDSGIGFAIPADHLRRRLPLLEDGKNLLRGLLGVRVDESAESDPTRKAGIMITEVAAGPAAKAGLQAGDRITDLDGIPTPAMLQFRRVLAARVAGETVAVGYVRGDEHQTASVTLASVEELGATVESQPAEAPATP